MGVDFRFLNTEKNAARIPLYSIPTYDFYTNLGNYFRSREKYRVSSRAFMAATKLAIKRATNGN